MRDLSGDEWPKHRKVYQHLTDDECKIIKAGYITRRPTREVARELQCSTRTIVKHYSVFRDQGIKQEAIHDTERKHGAKESP